MKVKVKILVIRFSSIGDIVLTTPVIRCLQQQIEGEAEIHYLTKKVYAPLLEHNPYLHRIHTIEKSTQEVIDQLSAENFDYIVDLHKNLRSSRVKRKLKGLSFSFDKLNWQKWLLVNLKINKMPKVHIVDRYLNAVKALGISNDGKGLDYFLPEGIEEKVPLPKFVQKGKYVALVLGATHATKRLPFDRLKELASLIPSPVVLIGGKEDENNGLMIEMQDASMIYNACGKTSLHESAWLIKNASYVITHDTGMMHIAAAFQKRIVSVWGNTVPDFGMYPYLQATKSTQYKVVEVSDLKCRPCSKIGYDKCPKGHFKCMQEINLQELILEK